MRFISLVCAFLLAAPSANALSFDFSFSNTVGNVAGTVTGTVSGLADNATGAATSLILTSVPAATGGQTNPNTSDVVQWTAIDVNSFTVTNGQITDFMFSAVLEAAPVFEFFCLGDPACAPVGAETLYGTAFFAVPFTFVGTDGGFAGVTFTPTAIPLPAGLLLMLSALGGLGAARRWRRDKGATRMAIRTNFRQ
ncbi:VPLPA-CTERM sorting domain-containing protein [Dinoroseobacter sp. S375]|uniref:VPLPA-CTERM sorting domain-containing protein n=1 Tax=Dinoroseobacter sp. S375 TaxID=3415136 RepID=UPI003C7C6318